MRYDAARAQAVAEEAIRAAAQAKDNPADLINVALDVLVKQGCELPGYTTLDEATKTIRAQVNRGFFASVADRIAPGHRAGLEHLLALDAFGPTEQWLQGVPPGKVGHFAGKARVTDVADLAKMRDDAKRLTLLASLVHVLRTATRDEVTEMFCRRMAVIHRKGRGPAGRRG